MVTEKFQILVCDRVSARGVALLAQHPEFNVIEVQQRLPKEEFLQLVKDASAIIVRSETKITEEIISAAPKLRAIARAGVGVDNIDVESATRHGIVVMNTPGGNTVSTAELTVGLLLALARNIPQAHMSMRNGEWNRKAFEGTEVRGKTLGILGLGRIGTEVAKMALGLGMRVIAYDPYISLSRAKSLQVELVHNLDELFAQADFITIHLPKTDETKGMINAETIRKMKRGVRIINCARGGIIVERDLVEAIQAGHVAGAALDVYETEPLPADSPIRKVPQIIMTPHLGASTFEAQDNVGIEAAELIADYLLKGIIRNAVNLPNLDQKTRELVQPYTMLGERLGKVLAQLAPTRIERMVITYGGRLVDLPSDPVTRSILIGFLSRSAGTEVNYVNSRGLAEQLGITVQEIKSSEQTDFHEWIEIQVIANGHRSSIAGTIFSAKHLPRIVRLNDQPVEIVPEGVIVLLKNKDRPGMVGHIGTVLGKYNVNIASMSLHRDRAGGTALTVLNLDSMPSPSALEELKNDPNIHELRVLQL